jgi:hypothetical protein
VPGEESGYASAGQKLNDQHNGREYQKQMDQATADTADES